MQQAGTRPYQCPPSVSPLTFPSVDHCISGYYVHLHLVLDWIPSLAQDTDTSPCHHRTHGTNRPFLPAQIRKNEPSFVKSATSSAFAAPSPPASTTSTFPSFPTEALKHLTTLTGVGPATATLLLSVHDPVDMPFFQDELYHWLCGSETKLKYNMKEYKELFEKVGELRQRLSNAVTADEMEKVGFVVGHLDLLEEEERKGLERQLEKSKDTVAGTEKKNESLKAKAPMANAAGKGKRQAPEDEEEKHATEAKAKRKRKSAAAETSTPTRKSQRSR
jgi:hypothetical protein